MPELAVADHVFARGKVWHLNGTSSILVVPTIGWELPWLPQLHRLTRDVHHLVFRKVLPDLGGGAPGRLLSGRVQRRPTSWNLHEVDGRLPEEDGGGLQVDGLMLHAHEDGPKRMIPCDLHRLRAIAIVQAGVRGNHVAHNLVHLLPVLLDLLDSGPHHVILVHVIPQHLVHADLHDGLHVRIHWVLQHSGHPQLIDVQAGRVSIVKDLGMSQAMNGRPVERLLTQKTSEEDLDHCPGVVEIFLDLLPGHLIEVGHGQSANGTIAAHTGAESRHGRLSGIPRHVSRQCQPCIFAAQIHHPLLPVCPRSSSFSWIFENPVMEVWRLRLRRQGRLWPARSCQKGSNGSRSRISMTNPWQGLLSKS
mmetsp:Transcript_27925/g.64938  ORF Transcript_27925/g.64938 Transcript_27925/m.64938 type:complete len:363 (+) Transcript_27925:1692-2780(+)